MNKSIDIPMSEEDLQELLADEEKEFNWTFDGVNVRIFRSEEEDEVEYEPIEGIDF